MKGPFDRTGIESNQVIISGIIELFFIKGRGGRDNPDNFTFDDAFGSAGIFNLFADSNAFTVLKQFADIGFRGMIGHTAHGNIFTLAGTAAGKGKA